jgi:uncharacterized protein (TIGR03437 family)
MAYDAAHEQVVMFGGQDASNENLNDTWVWDGTNWSQKFPATSPPGRSQHNMAYDAAHGQVVLFGGIVDGENPYALNDTWTWDGGNWTQQNPQASPSVRSDFGMVYDSVRGQVVLFGGAGFSANLNDTWTWDGANWTLQSPQTTPAARFGGALAFDLAHGQAILFGGLSYSSNPLGITWSDTWAWDGANWTQKSPQTSPPERYNGSVAYDSASGQIVLFGGSQATTFGTHTINDTWTWDGTNWTQQSPTTSPSVRLWPAIAYDYAHSQVVLTGGYDVFALQLVGDTWTWPGPAAPPPPTISNVISASAFGGFTSAAPGSWVEIYGSNLAPDTRGWTGSDFNGNNAPTSLDGVSVNIGGQAAFVDYISPTQVNAQLPSGVSTGGMLPVTVTNGNETSAASNIAVNPTQPGLLATAQFQIGTNQYVVAQLSDGNYVLPAGAIAGVNSRPAQPGETIVIYGVGFGPVTPGIAAGQVVTDMNQLVGSLQIFFGQTSAQMTYCGLAPSLIGLYQFDVLVPQVPDNDLIPLTFSLNGIQGTQTLFTAAQQ